MSLPHDAPQFSFFPHQPPPLRVSLQTLSPDTCPYLPDRQTMLRAFATRSMAPLDYHRFMDAGFRRSGQMIYQPVCTGCRECVPIRVPVKTFEPSKSQRRAIRRNADLKVKPGRPVPTQEKFDLYRRYCEHWHKKTEPETIPGFLSFLYESPVESAEFEYRLDGQLVGVGICDVCEDHSLSSVYFFFEPDLADRSLGTFGALYEIDIARQYEIPYYYLGFWIKDCRQMSYKSAFRPAETLGMDGVWRPMGA